MTFYGKNTFCFRRDQNFGPIAQWLETIGNYNRQCIVSLIIDFYMPNHCWQLANGVRLQNPERPDKLYQRSPRLHLAQPAKAGVVENINHPGLESMFASLFSCSRPAKQLNIVVKLKSMVLPGIEPSVGSPDYEPIGFSMDLPNLIELLRSECTLRCKNQPISITWESTGGHLDSNDKREAVFACGWEIVQVTPREYIGILTDLQQEWSPIVLSDVVLRRRPIQEPSATADEGFAYDMYGYESSFFSALVYSKRYPDGVKIKR